MAGLADAAQNWGEVDENGYPVRAASPQDIRAQRLSLMQAALSTAQVPPLSQPQQGDSFAPTRSPGLGATFAPTVRNLQPSEETPEAPDDGIVASGIRGFASALSGQTAGDLAFEAQKAEQSGDTARASQLRARATEALQSSQRLAPAVTDITKAKGLGDAAKWFVGQAGGLPAAAIDPATLGAIGSIVGSRFGPLGKTVGGLAGTFSGMYNDTSSGAAASQLSAELQGAPHLAPDEALASERKQGLGQAALYTAGAVPMVRGIMGNAARGKLLPTIRNEAALNAATMLGAGEVGRAGEAERNPGRDAGEDDNARINELVSGAALGVPFGAVHHAADMFHGGVEGAGDIAGGAAKGAGTVAGDVRDVAPAVFDVTKDRLNKLFGLDENTPANTEEGNILRTPQRNYGADVEGWKIDDAARNAAADKLSSQILNGEHPDAPQNVVAAATEFQQGAKTQDAWKNLSAAISDWATTAKADSKVTQAATSLGELLGAKGKEAYNATKEAYGAAKGAAENFAADVSTNMESRKNAQTPEGIDPHALALAASLRPLLTDEAAKTSNEALTNLAATIRALKPENLEKKNVVAQMFSLFKDPFAAVDAIKGSLERGSLSSEALTQRWNAFRDEAVLRSQKREESVQSLVARSIDPKVARAEGINEEDYGTVASSIAAWLQNHGHNASIDASMEYATAKLFGGNKEAVIGKIKKTLPKVKESPTAPTAAAKEPEERMGGEKAPEELAGITTNAYDPNLGERTVEHHLMSEKTGMAYDRTNEFHRNALVRDIAARQAKNNSHAAPQGILEALREKHAAHPEKAEAEIERLRQTHPTLSDEEINKRYAYIREEHTGDKYEPGDIKAHEFESVTPGDKGKKNIWAEDTGKNNESAKNNHLFFERNNGEGKEPSVFATSTNKLVKRARQGEYGADVNATKDQHKALMAGISSFLSAKNAEGARALTGRIGVPDKTQPRGIRWLKKGESLPDSVRLPSGESVGDVGKSYYKQSSTQQKWMMDWGVPGFLNWVKAKPAKLQATIRAALEKTLAEKSAPQNVPDKFYGRIKAALTKDWGSPDIQRTEAPVPLKSTLMEQIAKDPKAFLARMQLVSDKSRRAFRAAVLDALRNPKEGEPEGFEKNAAALLKKSWGENTETEAGAKTDRSAFAQMAEHAKQEYDHAVAVRDEEGAKKAKKVLDKIEKEATQDYEDTVRRADDLGHHDLADYLQEATSLGETITRVDEVKDALNHLSREDNADTDPMLRKSREVTNDILVQKYGPQVADRIPTALGKHGARIREALNEWFGPWTRVSKVLKVAEKWSDVPASVKAQIKYASVRDIQQLGEERGQFMKHFADAFATSIKAADRTYEEAVKIARDYIDRIYDGIVDAASGEIPDAFPAVRPADISYERYLRAPNGEKFDPNNLAHADASVLTRHYSWLEQTGRLEEARRAEAEHINRARGENIFQAMTGGTLLPLPLRALLIHTVANFEAVNDGRGGFFVRPLKKNTGIGVAATPEHIGRLAKHLSDGLSPRDALKAAVQEARDETLKKNKTQNGWVGFKQSDKMKDAQKLTDATTGRDEWCIATSVDAARAYLEQGDFHILFKDGEPIAAIRIENGKVAEINGTGVDQAPLPEEQAAAEKYLRDTKVPGSEEFLKRKELLKKLMDGSITDNEALALYSSHLEATHEKNASGILTLAAREAAEKKAFGRALSAKEAEELEGLVKYGVRRGDKIELLKLSAEGALETDLLSEADVRKKAEAWFGADSAEKMTEKILSIMKEKKEPAENVPLSKGDKGIQAFVHEGKAWLVGERVAKGDERAVFMHEVGHVGLGEEETKQFHEAVKSWKEAPEDSMERKVFERVEKRLENAKVPDEIRPSETVAYAIEEAVKAGVEPSPRAKGVAGWLFSVMREIRKLIREKFGARVKEITAQDLVDYTFGAAHFAIDRAAKEAQKEEPQGIRGALTKSSMLADETPARVRNVDEHGIEMLANKGNGELPTGNKGASRPGKPSVDSGAQIEQRKWLAETLGRGVPALVRAVSDMPADRLAAVRDGLVHAIKNPMAADEPSFALRAKNALKSVNELLRKADEREEENAPRQNAQAPKNDENPRATPEEVKAANDAITKRLGPSMKRVFVEDLGGHSADWTPDAQGNVIRIATNAVGGVHTNALHEAFHEFFDRLRKGKQTEVGRLLTRVANDAELGRSLQRILADHPEARESLKSTEERLAYAYQMWEAGHPLLRLEKPAKSLFMRVAKFLRKVTGLLNDDEKAVEIFKAFRKGNFAEDISVAGKVLAKLNTSAERVARVRASLEPLRKAATDWIGAAETNLATHSNPAVRALHAAYADPTNGYVTARTREQNKWMSEFKNAIEKHHEDDVQAALEGLQSGKFSTDEKIKAVQQDVRSFFDRIYEQYLKPAGVSTWNEEKQEYVPLPKRQDYFTRAWDVAELHDRGNEFVSRLVKEHADELKKMARGAESLEDTARSVLNSLVSSSGREDLPTSTYSAGLSPGMRSAHERSFAWISGEKFHDFMEKNLGTIVAGYVRQAARRAEYERRFGAGGKHLKDLMQQVMHDETAKQAGVAVNEKQFMALFKDPKKRLEAENAKNPLALAMLKADRSLAPVRRAILAMDGMLGQDISPRLRKAQGWVATYENLRFMPMALFSNMIDPLGIMVRGGTMNDAFNAYKRGLSAVIDTWKGKERESNLEHMMEAIGVLDASGFITSMADMAGSSYVGGKARRVNDALFKYNGMEAFNRQMRATAGEAAIGFLKRHATAPNEHSERLLGELKLDADYVKQHIGKDGALDITDTRIQHAVSQWVNEAILKPTAASIPSRMSDPHWALFSMYKGFLYASWKQIIKRAATETGYGNYSPASTLAFAYLPVMYASDMAKFIVQGSLAGTTEMPQWWSSMSAIDHVHYAAERAGFYGPGQVLRDAREYGVGSAMGPAFEQMTQAIHDPLNMTAGKAMPWYQFFSTAQHGVMD